MTYYDIEGKKKLIDDLLPTITNGSAILMHGDIGVGKTTFARILLNHLGCIYVPSPTFTMVQIYQTKIGEIWHFDLYRIEKSEDAWELDLEEALDNVVIVEWPNKLPTLPKSIKTINITLGIEREIHFAELSTS